MKTEKQLFKLAQKHLDIPENALFSQSSECWRDDQVNFVKVMMVEFHILMTKNKDDSQPKHNKKS